MPPALAKVCISRFILLPRYSIGSLLNGWPKAVIDRAWVEVEVRPLVSVTT
jgi:hypothetical protein